MFAIPFIDNDGAPQKYGSEFDQMYQLELRGNLQIPNEPVIDYNTGSKYTLYDNTDGIYNQEKLFENNDDPKEDQQVTSQQALERIRNNSSIDRPLTQSERRYNLYTDDNFDIRFRNQLIDESRKANDNIFSEFSQDHVRSIRDANTNYNKELNLYDTPQTLQNQFFTRERKQGRRETGFGDLSSMGIEALMDMARAEQKTQSEAQAFRDRQMPKSQPTMTQRFADLTKGKPNAPTPPTRTRKPDRPYKEEL